VSHRIFLAEFTVQRPQDEWWVTYGAGSIQLGDILDVSGTQHLTVELWFKPHKKISSTYQQLIGDTLKFFDSTERTGWALAYTNSDGAGCALYMIAEETSGNISVNAKAYFSYRFDGWHHIAGVLDRDVDELRLYIDGALAAITDASDLSAVSLLNTNFTVIGDDENNNHPYSGHMREVRIWHNTVRTEQQIRDNMHSVMVGTETGLDGYWRLDGRVDDRAPGGNDGIRFGYSRWKRSTSTLYTSSEPYSTATQRYEARLLNPGTVDRSLFNSGQLGGPSVPGYGDIELANADGGLDWLRDVRVDGRAVHTLYYDREPMEAMPARSAFSTIIKGTTDSDFQIATETVTVGVADRQAELDKYVCTNVYTGAGSAVVLDGTDDYVGGLGDVHDFDTGDFSVAVRLFIPGDITEANQHTIISKYTATDGWEMYFGGATLGGDLNRAFAFHTGSLSLGEVISPQWVIELETWYWVIATRDATNEITRLYVNGEEVARTHTSIDPPGNALNLEIGRRSGASSYGRFMLQEVSLWDKKLSPSNINDIMEGSIEDDDSNLLAWWRAFDGTGTTLYDYADVTTPNDGTIYDGATPTGVWGSSLEGFEDITERRPSGEEGGGGGQRKPIAWGKVENVAPPMVDHQKLIYQVNDGPIQEVLAVYDKGVALSADTDEGVGGVIPDLITFCTTTPDAGEYTVCPRFGVIRLGSLTEDGTCTVTFWGSAPLGSCLDFDGTDDQVSLGNIWPSAIGDVDITAEMWFTADSVTDHGTYLLYSYSASGGFRVQIRYVSPVFRGIRVLRYTSGGNESADTRSHLINKEPHHLAVVFRTSGSDNAASLYIDGKLMDESPVSATGLGTTSEIWYLGSAPAGGYWDGKIGEARVWVYARTEQQINDWMYRPLERWRPGGAQAIECRSTGSKYAIATDTNEVLGWGGDGTVMFWMNVTDTGRLLDHANASAGSSYFYFNYSTGTGILTFSLNDGGVGGADIFTFSVPYTGTWFHVAAVVEDGQAVLYVDTELRDSGATSYVLGVADSASKLAVGASIGGTSIDVDICELSIWERALSQDEIWQKHNTQLDPDDENDLVAYYQCDGDMTDEVGTLDLTEQNSPTYTSDQPLASGLLAYYPEDRTYPSATLVDQSGNNNDGTITGAVWQGSPAFGAIHHAAYDAVVNRGEMAHEDLSVLTLPNVSYGAETVTAAMSLLAERIFPPVGYLATDTETIMQALDAIVSAHLGWYNFDDDGLFELGLIRDPDDYSYTPIEYDSTNIVSLEAVQLDLPIYRVGCAYRNNWHVQDGDAVAGSVSDNRREFLAKAQRFATRSNWDTRKDFLLARDEEVGTFWTRRKPAVWDCLERLDLYGVYRQAFNLVSWEGTSIGRTATVTWNRFGLDSGKAFLVLAATRDEISNTVTMTIWG
jgi:hypothetical protein